MKSKKTNQPTIGIIGGKGSMGSLFADFFVNQKINTLISDQGTDLDNKTLAQQSDIVIISVPIPVTTQVIQEITPFLKPNALLTDLTSIKVEPIHEMLKSKSEVLGMHPMFGSTNSLQGQRIIFCPARPATWTDYLKKLFQSNEIVIEEMTPQDHDKTMTIVQGLVHFADITFAHTLKDLGIPPQEFLKFASPPSELKIAFAARILAQDPTLYGSMQIYNDLNVPTFQAYLKNIQKLLNINETKHLGAFKDYFQEAANYLADYKDRALKETNWIIDKVLENRHKHQIATGKTTPLPERPAPKPNQIATLGPSNTYSEIITKKYISKNAPGSTPYLCSSITEAFELVSKSNTQKAIVPIENSTQGTVRETFDALFKYDVQIIDEIKMPIHHCLIGLPESDINQAISIISHPQALNQCRSFLANNFPHIQKIQTPSTTAALNKIIKEKDPQLLAISSEEAAKNLNLKILAENIEDVSNNQTNFILIRKTAPTQAPSQTPPPAGLPYKTSIIFYFDADTPGTLAEILDILASRKINLTKIESRPSQKSLGDYFFYIDFEGHQSTPSVKEALDLISQKVAHLKILGSY